MVFAGAMFAGMALGRLFKSTPPSDDATAGNYGSDATGSGRYGSESDTAGSGRYGSGSGRKGTFGTSPTTSDTSFPSTPNRSAGLSGSAGESKL